VLRATTIVVQLAAPARNILDTSSYKENETRLLSGRRRLHLYAISLSGIRSNGGYGCLIMVMCSRQYFKQTTILTLLGEEDEVAEKSR
jgi:hypothetical protein